MRRPVLLDLNKTFAMNGKHLATKKSKWKRTFYEAWWMFFLGAGIYLTVWFLTFHTSYLDNLGEFADPLLTLSIFILAICLSVLLAKAEMYYRNALDAYMHLVASSDMLQIAVCKAKDKKLRKQMFNVLRYLLYSVFLFSGNKPFVVKVKDHIGQVSLYDPIVVYLAHLSEKAGIDQQLVWSSAGMFRFTMSRSIQNINVRFGIRKGFYISVIVFYLLTCVLVSFDIANTFHPVAATLIIGIVSYGIGLMLYTASYESHPLSGGSYNVDLYQRFLRFLEKINESEALTLKLESEKST